MGLDQRLSLFPVLVQDSCPLEVAWDWTSDSPCSLSWSRIRVLWRLHGTGPATLPVPCPGPGFVSSGGCMGLDQRLSLFPVLVQDSCPLEVSWDWTSDSPLSHLYICVQILIWNGWSIYATCCSLYVYPSSLCTLLFQWSFGVTMWEIFSGGRSPYPGVGPFTLIRFLNEGGRLDKSANAACSHEM